MELNQLFCVTQRNMSPFFFFLFTENLENFMRSVVLIVGRSSGKVIANNIFKFLSWHSLLY